MTKFHSVVGKVVRRANLFGNQLSSTFRTPLAREILVSGFCNIVTP